MKVYKDTTREYYDELTFEPSPLLQEWVVPNGITKVHVDCVASKGANSTSIGGNGGRVQCDLSVTPNQTLYFVVGITPSDSRIASYNASDIRTNNSGITNSTSLNSRLIVAGGGGSGSWGNGNTAGGAGGGLIGENANDTGCSGGGEGGTQSAGGAGGRDIPWTSQNVSSGNNGSLGLGGNGASNSAGGGAGGSGYYGGGGGAAGYTKDAGNYGAGGGGGSSYTDPNRCSNVVHTQGYNDGEGYITISTLNGEHFYKDVNSYKVIKNTVRTYYKHITFTSDSTFTVPSSITKLKVDCVASRGNGSSNPWGTYYGGSGGRVQCYLNVTGVQTLYIIVGAISTENNGTPVYNASDIRIGGNTLNDRVIVAGGGGNAAYGGFVESNGGAGGGEIGGSTSNIYAGTTYGGTQTEGGGGSTQGQFGNGGAGTGLNGGAGGAGWYGGGGGNGIYMKNSGVYACGGGGGSSYIDTSVCSQIPNIDIHTQGYNDGAGYVNIDYPSTSSDYDYYIDETDYKAFKI